MAALRYRTIVADPPWPYPRGDQGAPGASRPKLNGQPRKSASPSYSAMTLAAIQAVRVPSADDAHLYLWTTNRFMDEAFDVARAWGFVPKTILTWTKTEQGAPTRVSMRVGYYFRGATEHVIFGVRGSLPTLTGDLPTGYLWPRLPHSVKPDAFYDLVERASPGPYVELFARRARFGWDYYGDESLGTAPMPEPAVVSPASSERRRCAPPTASCPRSTSSKPPFAPATSACSKVPNGSA
jgi:N6-adenosine-specific RNA methylase IME4